MDFLNMARPTCSSQGASTMRQNPCHVGLPNPDEWVVHKMNKFNSKEVLNDFLVLPNWPFDTIYSKKSDKCQYKLPADSKSLFSDNEDVDSDDDDDNYVDHDDEEEEEEEEEEEDNNLPFKGQVNNFPETSDHGVCERREDSVPQPFTGTETEITRPNGSTGPHSPSLRESKLQNFMETESDIHGSSIHHPVSETVPGNSEMYINGFVSASELFHEDLMTCKRLETVHLGEEKHSLKVASGGKLALKYSENDTMDPDIRGFRRPQLSTSKTSEFHNTAKLHKSLDAVHEVHPRASLRLPALTNKTTAKSYFKEDSGVSFTPYLGKQVTDNYWQEISHHRESPLQLLVLPVFGPQSMAVEGMRLQTFLRYPGANLLSALRLANAGFYYTGQGDAVECYSCEVTFICTEENQREDPYQIHRQLSPACPHVSGQDHRNVFVQDSQRQAQSALDITEQGDREARPGNPEVREIVDAAKRDLQLVRNLLAEVGIALQPMVTEGGDPQVLGVAANRGAEAPSPGESGNVLNGWESSENIATEPREPSNDTQPNEELARNHVGTHSQAARSQLAATAAASMPMLQSDTMGIPRLENLQEPAPNEAYDPSRATHRNYCDRSRRLISFSTWPETHAQSPEALAMCGFFHTGIGDCVRCHYCGLGLKHWDPDDDPLEEHVRWRSSCGYLRALLGDDVIARVLAELGRRRRNDQNSEETQSLGTAERRGSAAPERSAAGSTQTNGGTAAVPTNPASPVDTVASLMTSQAAQSTREMGFADDVIERAIRALVGTRAGVRAVTSQNLVHTILYIRERGQSDVRDEEWSSDSDSGGEDDTPSLPSPGLASPSSTTSTSTSTIATSRANSSSSSTSATISTTGSSAGLSAPAGGLVGASAERGSRVQTSGSPEAAARSTFKGDREDAERTAEQLEQENQELRERRRCKICLDNDVSILFLPCGHLVCCPECAAALLRCPICRIRIRGRVRTQMAPIPPPDNSSQSGK